MEVLIISVLIAALLIGWLVLMRVEVAVFLQRVMSGASEDAPASGPKRVTPGVHVVSVRHTSTSSVASANKEPNERK